MPSHLSCIGFPINDQDELLALANRITSLATLVEMDGGCYLQWSSECGAELWLQIDAKGDLIGLTPFFSGGSRVRTRIDARVARPDNTPHEGAFHGWAAPVDNAPESGEYPFVFDVVDYGRYASLAMPTTVNVTLAAFAHEISVYPTLDAYNKAQASKLKFASRSFIPSGLFSPEGESIDPPESMAIFTGHVVATEIKKNSLTAAKYYWALVDTLGGLFDVVIDPEICIKPPIVGGIVSGAFWLCGRLAVESASTS